MPLRGERVDSLVVVEEVLDGVVRVVVGVEGFAEELVVVVTPPSSLSSSSLEETDSSSQESRTSGAFSFPLPLFLGMVVGLSVDLLGLGLSGSLEESGWKMSTCVRGET